MNPFKPEVFNAPGYQTWRIVSALRGPDTDFVEGGTKLNQLAKQFTIAVRRAALSEDGIHESRGLMFLEYGDGIGYLSPTPEDLVDGFLSQPSHWREHTENGLLAASQLKILDDYGKLLYELIRDVHSND